MNTRKVTAAVVAIVLGCVSALSGDAKVTKLSLQEMVARSELIVVARVSEIRDTGESRMGNPVAMIRISVETTLKGRAHRSLDIYEIPTAIETAQFTIYDKCVFFLARHESQLWVVQGFAGKVNIVGDNAKDIYIAGEEETQPVQSFLARIAVAATGQ